MSFETAVEDILINVLERSRHPGVEISHKDLSRDRFTNGDFDDIFKDLCELLDELGLDERDRKFDAVAKPLAIMLICEWADEEGLTDRLGRRDMDDIEDEIEKLGDIRDEIKNGGRGRRGGHRRRTRRDDDDYRTGDRSSRSGGRRGRGRGRDDDDDDRRSGRRRGGNGGFSTRRSRRGKDDDQPKTIVQRKAESSRNTAEEPEVEQPLTPAQIRRNNRRNEEERPYDFVGEKEEAAVPMSKTEEELGFTYAEVPVGTLADYRDLGINVEDKDFIITRPIDREDTYRDALYDPYAVQPVWKLNEKGLRVLRWREFNMNIDNHVIPDFTRSSVTPRREVDGRVLSSLMQPTRRSILSISNDADKADRKYEDDLTEWEVNNKDRAPDEQEEKPETPALQKLGNHTLRVDEPVETSSLADMIQESMLRFSNVRTLTEGNAPIEAFGPRRRFAYLAESAEQRDEIMSLIEMFTTSHSHRTADNSVVPLHKYHDALMATVETIPHGLWKRINRRLTDYANEIFNISLGLSLTIDDFAADGGEIIQYLHATYGEKVMEAFIIAHAQVGGRLSMLEAGKGEADLMIYEVENTQVTILPVTPEELSISSVTLGDKVAHGKAALVTGESNLKLFNALRTIWTQSTPVMGKQTPYKYIAFSDGSVFRIDRNAMNLSGQAQRDSVEFLLTQVNYC